MDVIVERLAREHPKTNGGTRIFVLPLSEVVTDSGTRDLLLIWQAAVAFILLIACVNVANLLVARGLDRHKELALRMALGAGRLRVTRQLMTENLLLALLGAMLAVPLAFVGIELLGALMPARRQREHGPADLAGRRSDWKTVLAGRGLRRPLDDGRRRGRRRHTSLGSRSSTDILSPTGSGARTKNESRDPHPRGAKLHRSRSSGAAEAGGSQPIDL